MEEQPKKLYRSQKDRLIAGVCGGLGEYFNLDPVLLRIIFVALTFINGSGIILYLVLAIIVPNEPAEKVAADKKGKIKEVAEEVTKGAQTVVDEVAKGAKSLASDLQEKQGWFSDKRNLLGIIIILIGVAALLDQVLPTVFNWNIFWPMLIILVGIYIIFRK